MIPFKISSLIHILILICFICLSCSIQTFSQAVLNKIFNENQYFVIYTLYFQQQNQNNLKQFDQFCFYYQKCAILNKQNKLFSNIRQFVGHSSKEYFLILDAPRQQKFIFQAQNEQINEKNLQNFKQNFVSGSLQPFYSSQQIPIQIYQPCRKLVGKNFDNFLQLQTPIKVVYLYTEKESCTICRQMLRGYADISQKIFRTDVIVFGYFDIYKNDHPKITSQIAPYFLVFHEGQNDPYGIQGERFSQLQNALLNIVAKQLYPDYQIQAKSNNHKQIQDQIQLDTDQLKEADFQIEEHPRVRNMLQL